MSKEKYMFSNEQITFIFVYLNQIEKYTIIIQIVSFQLYDLKFCVARFERNLKIYIMAS